VDLRSGSRQEEPLNGCHVTLLHSFLSYSGLRPAMAELFFSFSYPLLDSDFVTLGYMLLSGELLCMAGCKCIAGAREVEYTSLLQIMAGLVWNCDSIVHGGVGGAPADGA
jgi:hypothetical protein